MTATITLNTAPHKKARITFRHGSLPYRAVLRIHTVKMTGIVNAETKDAEKVRRIREARQRSTRSAVPEFADLFSKLCMGRREAGDRYPEGRTRYVVEAEEVAQLDARRIPAVLAADPDLQVLADSSTFLDAGPHKLADALAVQGLERIEGENPPFYEVQEELALGVVPAVPERRLREIVRPEGEELGMSGNRIGRECGPRKLNHGPELVSDRDALALHDLLRLPLEGFPLDLEFVHMARERDHDFRLHDDPLLSQGAGRLEDRPDLHLRDFGEGDAEAAAPEAQHRVRLPGRRNRLAGAASPVGAPRSLGRG